MLVKRTNILFDEELWKQLREVAKEKGLSIGELVRRAVRKAYFKKSRDQRISRAYQSILKNRVFVKGIDYKELIEDGRRY